MLCDLWPNMMFGNFAKLPYQQQLFPGACCCMCICKAALVEIFRWRDLITSANIANCQLKGTHHKAHPWVETCDAMTYSLEKFGAGTQKWSWMVQMMFLYSSVIFRLHVNV